MDKYNLEEIENRLETNNSINDIYEEFNNPNALTGDSRFLYYQLKMSIMNAERIDIIVSFLMESGVRLIIDDLRNALNRGVKIRILSGNYLGITQPSALFLIKKELQDQVDLRLYNNPNKSFHPKAYIFHFKNDSEMYIGSSNLSRGALTSSIEWNYRFLKSVNANAFETFNHSFNDLFDHHAYKVTDEVLYDYTKNWKKPNVQKDFDKYEIKNIKVENMFHPQGAQIEALYSLEKSRKEGFDKGIVVAATGIGKTYLAAFDSVNYKRILFVAHREEILRQAAESFYNIRKTDDFGFFNGEQKDTDKSVVFASVQSLGKDEFLNDKYFSKDYFDYIVIDEFHHAVTGNYQNIINYFTPQFLLGLTATPERLDAQNVFELCDYNIVYEVGLFEAINKGWLVPFHYYGIYDETVNYDNIHFISGKYDDKDLEEALMIGKRSELIYKHYMKYKSKRALGFCSSKAHAEFMAGEFCKRGIPSVAVYSGSQGDNSAERKDAVKSLSKGEIRIIFSVDMFNEGLDIKNIDMVMFLRPTQSPTVFLQQLGRGLRKCKSKEFLNVLDFIGNYKKANMIPTFIGNNSNLSKLKTDSLPEDFEYPDDCFVDFDFHLIDIFNIQNKQEMSIKDRVKLQFEQTREELEHVPTRIELFTYMEPDLYDLVRTKSKINVFTRYLDFLKEMNCLSIEEEQLCVGRGKDFINMIETTSMSKTYKMPLLLAFYNKGKIKMSINEEDIYHSFYEFYHKGSNKVDMFKDASTKGFESWDKKKYVKLAMDNPIHFMLETHGDFFAKEDGAILKLQNDLLNNIESEAFINHMKDAIDYRVISYYRNRRKI